MFSLRTAHDATLNALAAALDRARGGGAELLDLSVTNPTRAGLPYDGPVLRSALADPAALLYEPEAQGRRDTREVVAQLLGVPGVGAEHVVLTASTSEAYAYLFKVLCDPGDEVLVPAPSYPLLAHLAVFEGVRLVPYRLAYDGEWHLDAASARAAVGARTRAVVVVHPNNPTGHFTKQQDLALLRELDLPVICDEVFAAYPLEQDARAVPSLLGVAGLRVFTLGGLSKFCGLPQLKLAWTALSGPEPWRREALERLELVADTFLSPGTPVQVALPALLAAGQGTRAAIQARTAGNLAVLRQGLRDAPVSVLKVEGGWSAVLRLPRTRTDLEWALLLLAQDGVVVQPGYYFDMEDRAALVLSLLTPELTFRAGLERLRRRVEISA